MTKQELKDIEDKLCYSQEWCRDGFCKDTEENRCAIQLLLEMFEKQIPKKPATKAETEWDIRITTDIVLVAESFCVLKLNMKMVTELIIVTTADRN